MIDHTVIVLNDEKVEVGRQTVSMAVGSNLYLVLMQAKSQGLDAPAGRHTYLNERLIPESLEREHRLERPTTVVVLPNTRERETVIID